MHQVVRPSTQLVGYRGRLENEGGQERSNCCAVLLWLSLSAQAAARFRGPATKCDALRVRSEGHAGHSCSVRFLSQVGLERARRMTSAARLRHSLVVSDSAATGGGLSTCRHSSNSTGAAAPAVVSHQVAVAHFAYPTSLAYLLYEYSSSSGSSRSSSSGNSTSSVLLLVVLMYSTVAPDKWGRRW